MSSNVGAIDRSPRTRREVLKIAGAAAGGAALAQLGVPAIGTARSATTLAALERRLGGTLIVPGDITYGPAAAIWNTRLQIAPRAIAFCQSVSDVRAVVAFARGRGWPIAARSGRHSFEGYCNTTGIVCDVSALTDVRFDRVHGTVALGAGNNVQSIWESVVVGGGRGIQNGSCPTVGIGGLALGGGFTTEMRKYGVLVDDIVGVSLVLTDGRYVHASATQRPKLFWALRGGGGGNFGIVTSFTMRTHGAPAVYNFALSFVWSKAAEVYDVWQTLAPLAPKEMASCTLRLARAPVTPDGAAYELHTEITGKWMGSKADLEDLLAPLVALGPRVVPITITRTPYAVAHQPGGCKLAVDGSVNCVTTGSSGDYPNYQRSDFFTKPVAAAGIAEIVAQVERWPGGPGSYEGGVQIEATGAPSKVNQVASDALAWVHRDTIYHTVYLNFWGQPQSAAANIEWVNDFYAQMRPYASGQAYQNYIDSGLKSWRSAYYGDNWKRLQKIKRAYDPDNVLAFAQGITPAR